MDFEVFGDKMIYVFKDLYFIKKLVNGMIFVFVVVVYKCNKNRFVGNVMVLFKGGNVIFRFFIEFLVSKIVL